MRQTALARLVNRRQRLLHLTTAGIPITDAVGMLSSELSVSKCTLWKDWKTRSEWLPLLLQIKPEERENVILVTLARLSEATQEAYKTYVSCRVEMARVAALRLYLEAIKVEVELRQSLGLLTSRSLRVDERIVMIEGRFCRVTPEGKATPINPSKGHYQWQEDADQQADGTGLPAP